MRSYISTLRRLQKRRFGPLLSVAPSLKKKERTSVYKLKVEKRKSKCVKLPKKSCIANPDCKHVTKKGKRRAHCRTNKNIARKSKFAVRK
tara:strand:- start:1627 stop:1896 length:270 start_codon:yes stop_codon:yes gene_type:complete